jgi:hypothetical protein
MDESDTAVMLHSTPGRWLLWSRGISSQEVVRGCTGFNVRDSQKHCRPNVTPLPLPVNGQLQGSIRCASGHAWAERYARNMASRYQEMFSRRPRACRISKLLTEGLTRGALRM